MYSVVNLFPYFQVAEVVVEVVAVVGVGVKEKM
jgi:hypothetical protein